MKKNWVFAVVCIVTLAFIGVGCTDAQWGKVTSLGDPAKVMCYSGGVLIYSGYSTGKVSSEESSDGYFFKDSADGRQKEVSGNCVIDYNAPK